MKTAIKRPWILGLLCCIGLNAHAARINIDTDWKFNLGDQNLAQTVAYDDSQWRSLDVPHDWSIEQEFSETNSSRHAWLPGGIGWYRKQLMLPAEDAGEQVELQFDGVYKHASVWVNGRHVGTQYDGYTSFHFDVTPLMKFGQMNTIAVRIDNAQQPNCRWYSGSGIFRHVWLRLTNPVHVKTQGTYITTPAITSSEATVRIRTTIQNRRAKKADIVLLTELFDASGKKAGSTQTACNTGAKLSVEIEQELSLFSPALWSVETPQMYTAVSKIIQNDKVLNQYTSTFGVRDIRFDAEKGFFLNGKNMKLKGVCLHAEAGTFGAAVPIQKWERRLKGLKSAGCNAIRTAHNPMAPEFMDLCDSMGFLVMDEFVDKWDDRRFADPFFRQEWKKNFESTIQRDRNHPCVVIWSVGNENHAPGSTEQTESLQRYCNFVRSIDPTRPVISGMQRGMDQLPADKVDNVLRSCEHMDLIGMNYGLQWSKRIALRKPGKVFLSTETLPYYSHDEVERWAHIEKLTWFDVMANDSNIGSFMWAGTKYLGEIPAKGLHSWPEIFCWPGCILDSAGFRSDLSYLYQALWTDEPTLHIAVYEKDVAYNKQWGAPPTKSMWNYATGEQLDLVTYSNCDYVELYLNDHRIGTQKLSDFSNWVMKWHKIDYEPGTLRAVGIRDGIAVCESTLKTAGKPVQLALKVDRPELCPDNVVHVEVQLLDASSNPVRHDDRDLKFSIKGGEIIALDNGHLTAKDSMKEMNIRQTNQGRCLATLKAIQPPETLTLTVEAKDILSQSVTIDIK